MEEFEFKIGWKGKTRHGMSAEIQASNKGDFFGFVGEVGNLAILSRWRPDGAATKDGEEANDFDLMPNA